MCQESSEEIQRGKEAALQLVQHLQRMGAKNCMISIESGGKEYLVQATVLSIEQQNFERGGIVP